MKLSLVISAKTKFTGITVDHNGKKVTFKADGTVKGGKNENDLFLCFNNYAEIVLNDNEKDELFNLYQQAHFVLEPTTEGHQSECEVYLQNNHNKDFLISKLVPIIDRVIEIINPSRLTYFIDSEGIYTELPHDLDMNQNKGDYPDAKTINGHDYQNLVKFILTFQPAFPIINAFITHLESKKITKDCKELVAGNLIKNNPYLVNSPSWKKILGYISYDVVNKNINNLKVDVSNDNSFIENTAFKIMFTRFLVFLIPNPDKTKNLAKQIFNGIRQIDTEGGNFRDKRPASEDNTDKRSNIEMYQLYEETKSADEIADAEFFSFSHFDEEDNQRFKNRFTAQCMAMGIKDESMVEYCFDLIPNNWNFQLRPHIVQLLQLALIDVVSPFIINILDYHQLMAAMALSQVKLHEMGYPNLAVLVTTLYDPKAPRSNGGNFDTLDSNDRAIIEQICRVDQAQGESLVKNEGVAAADAFLKEVFSKGWVSTIEVDMIGDKNAMETSQLGVMHEVDLSHEVKKEFISLIQAQNN